MSGIEWSDAAHVQAGIDDAYDRAAGRYESEVGHGISAAERAFWLDLVSSFVPLVPGDAVLDVGAGTGSLTALMAATGASVTGLDPSTGMLEVAQENFASAQPRTEATFVHGDTHAGDTFAPCCFELIVSRQAVCYLTDPLLAFANWHRWLKDGGRAVVVDGLWSRTGWENGPLIDRLPLSCLQTTATVAYLLERSGFRIDKTVWLDRVDHADAASALRYAVLASKVSLPAVENDSRLT